MMAPNSPSAQSAAAKSEVVRRQACSVWIQCNGKQRLAAVLKCMTVVYKIGYLSRYCTRPRFVLTSEPLMPTKCLCDDSSRLEAQLRAACKTVIGDVIPRLSNILNKIK